MNMPVKPPRPHSLYDFRMQDVSYEIVTLGAGENLPRRAGIAGYFYHVLKGSVQVTSADYGATVAGCRDTIIVSGFIGHSVEQPRYLSYPRFILVGPLGIQSKVRYDLKLSRVEETTSCARHQTISFQSD